MLTRRPLGLDEAEALRQVAALGLPLGVHAQAEADVNVLDALPLFLGGNFLRPMFVLTQYV